MHHDSCRAAGDPLEGPLYPGPRHFSWGGCPLAPSPLTNCLCVLTGPNFEGRCHARQRLAREIDGDARWGRHRGKWHHIARGWQASPLRGISPRRRCATFFFFFFFFIPCTIIQAARPATPSRVLSTQDRGTFRGEAAPLPLLPCPCQSRWQGMSPTFHAPLFRPRGRRPPQGPLYPGQRHFSWGGCSSAPSPLALPESLAGHFPHIPCTIIQAAQPATPSRVLSTQDRGTFRGEAAPRPLLPCPCQSH